MMITYIPRRVLIGPPRMFSTNRKVAPLCTWQSCNDCPSSSSLDCQTRCCWDAGMPVIQQCSGGYKVLSSPQNYSENVQTFLKWSL